MIVDLIYAVGDNIQYIKYSGEIEKNECGFCVGTGNISGHDGTIAECPKCHGTGIIETDDRGRADAFGKVTDIRVSWQRNPDTGVGTVNWVEYQVDNEYWVNIKDIIGRVQEYVN